MKTIRLNQYYRDVRSLLRANACDNPDLTARLFLKEALGISDTAIINNESVSLSIEQLAQIEAFIAKRCQGTPVSRIFGERDFWDLTFTVTPAVLDPRPDSEALIEAAWHRHKNSPPERILDLGTGSGCLLITLLTLWPSAHGTGVDLSEEALAVAQDNAVHNNVDDRCDFLVSDWGQSVDGRFDLIVTNPPYIPNRDIPNLAREVRNHDPILSLDGGKNGLDAYNKIIPTLKTLLSRDGFSFLEIGQNQESDVTRIVKDYGFTVRNVHPDLSGIPRVVEISFGEKQKNS